MHLRGGASDSKNGRPCYLSCLWSAIKRPMLQSTVVQRVREPTSATCLWSGSFFGMARRLLSCEILTEAVHPCAQAACSAISIGQTAASLHNSNGILSPPILKLSALRSDTPTLLKLLATG